LWNLSRQRLPDSCSVEPAAKADRPAQTDAETDAQIDHDLVQRCVQGDRHSFRVLYQRHQQRVRAILYTQGVVHGEGLDDGVQEVFLRAWKGLPQFRQTAQFSTWLYRIAWNVAVDLHKRQRRQVAQQRAIAHDPTTHGIPSSVMNSAVHPNAEMGTRERSPAGDDALLHLHYQDVVQRGLAQLSPDHRQILMLHDLHDLPQKEIAALLDIPVGTVKSRLFHARAALRRFLHQQGVQL
jgi:RNA polymerase sigma factor (sigma-70 family)